MARESVSAEEPKLVSVYQRRGFAEVRLRKDAREDVADMPDGTSVTFWRCEEESLTIRGTVTEQYVEEHFDELWALAESESDRTVEGLDRRVSSLAVELASRQEN